MVGFACNETPELMPLPIALAHALTRRLSVARRSGTAALPAPGRQEPGDGRVQQRQARARRYDRHLDAARAGDQQRADSRATSAQSVINEVVPEGMLDAKTNIYVNPSGRFVIGGPMGDAGLTGRKIIVDTYGGMARHGGGAFSGKDPTKVDRSAAYAARYVAKNVVAAGLAERFELQLSYAIGVAHPLSISVETFGTGKVDDESILALINEHFDLRPGAIIRDLEPAPPDLPPDGGLRPLRPRRPRRALGADRQGRPAAPRRRPGPGRGRRQRRLSTTKLANSRRAPGQSAGRAANPADRPLSLGYPNEFMPNIKIGFGHDLIPQEQAIREPADYHAVLAAVAAAGPRSIPSPTAPASVIASAADPRRVGATGPGLARAQLRGPIAGTVSLPDRRQCGALLVSLRQCQPEPPGDRRSRRGLGGAHRPRARCLHG